MVELARCVLKLPRSTVSRRLNMPPKSSLTRRSSAKSWKPPKSSLTAKVKTVSKPPRSSVTRWREDVPAIWSFWVPVQTLNFLVSPLWARVPVTAAASLLWTSYVSFSRGCPGPCPQNAPTRCDGGASG